MTTAKAPVIALLAALVMAPIGALADDDAQKTDTNQAADSSGGDSSAGTQGKDADAQAVEDMAKRCGEAAMAIGMVYWAQNCKNSND